MSVFVIVAAMSQETQKYTVILVVKNALFVNEVIPIINMLKLVKKG